jgi:hypothetical protein
VLSPVSAEFDSPFAFRGRIEQVVFELGDDRTGSPPDTVVD